MRVPTHYPGLARRILSKAGSDPTRLLDRTDAHIRKQPRVSGDSAQVRTTGQWAVAQHYLSLCLPSCLNAEQSTGRSSLVGEILAVTNCMCLDLTHPPNHRCLAATWRALSTGPWS
jgi:hypothetical protein